MREFKTGDTVHIRNYSGKHKWLPGRIHKRVSNVIYEVDVYGSLHKRHIDQIFIRFVNDPYADDYMDFEFKDTRASKRKIYPKRNRKPPVRYGYHE